jgi:protein DJ-1
LIRQCNAAGSYTAFICAATIALVAAYERPLEGIAVTSHPSVKEEVVRAGWEYAEERVEVSGKVVTSRG